MLWSFQATQSLVSTNTASEQEEVSAKLSASSGFTVSADDAKTGYRKNNLQSHQPSMPALPEHEESL